MAAWMVCLIVLAAASWLTLSTYLYACTVLYFGVFFEFFGSGWRPSKVRTRTSSRARHLGLVLAALCLASGLYQLWTQYGWLAAF